MVEGCDLRAGRQQAPPEGCQRRPEPSFFTHHDVTAGQGWRSTAEAFPIAHGGDELGLLVAGSDSRKLHQRGGTEDPVNRQAGITLKLPECKRRGVPKDAVDPARIEPESPEPLLKLGDVITAQHWGSPIEEPISQCEAGLDQSVPSLRTTDAVHSEAPKMLEPLYGNPRSAPENALRIGRRVEADLMEPALELGHTGTEGTLAEGQRLINPHRRAADLGAYR